MINMQVRSEAGEIVARAGCGLEWSEDLAGLDEAGFPMLGSLIPYGDAVFNTRQVPVLMRELGRIPAGLQGPWVQEARALGQIVLDGSHRYLWFLGD